MINPQWGFNPMNKISIIIRMLFAVTLFQQEDVIILKNQEPKLMKAPPYPDRLVIEKPTTRPEFDILNELHNICVKIPLLQAIKDIPIYSKVVKELCIKKPGRK
jgi:hypothetical protein